ncbi:MAG: hypothetical protein MJ071_01095 [Oscillospiraceae bacterium]|nr:hypothetical protein [Oscillospiraceae bacterium]
MKKKKGMTLMEIIVSCAVYALFSLLIAEIMTLVNSTMRATNQLNKRLTYQSKYADNMLTSDANGSFGRQSIQYRIRYDGTFDEAHSTWTTGTKYVKVNPNAANASYDINNANDPGNVRDGDEYTTNYDTSALTSAGLTVYNQNVNYRFMSFDRVERVAGEWPGPVFNVYFRLVPYFDSDKNTLTDAQKQSYTNQAASKIAKMEKIYIEYVGGAATFVSGTSFEINGPFDKNSMAQNYVLAVNNPCENLDPAIQNVMGSIKATVTGNVYGSTIDKWTEAPVDYYLYVKLGSLDRNKTYYDKTVIEYNINDQTFKPMDSFKESDSIPTQDYLTYIP